MSSLASCFQAERIKWRKSWTLLVVLLAPICQTGFLGILMWYSDVLVKQYKPGFRFWLEVSYLTWNLILMPITVALVSELSWGMEEEARAWDHLLLQPVPHRTHYLAKLLSHVSLLFFSQIILALLLVPVGLVLRRNWNLAMGHVPSQVLVQFAVFTFMASLPLVAFHTWLTTRLSGLGIALAMAFVGTWLCVQLVGLSALIQILPWGLSSQFVIVLDRSKHLPWTYVPGSLLCAALLTGLGTLDFQRRNQPRS